MFFWFAVVSAVFIAEVFRSPKLDYRLVSFGSVFPLLGVISFIPNVFHSFIFSVAVLIVVMLGTVGRRLLRRKLLGFPIGLFAHLVLDFSWLYDSSFLWPLFGKDLDLLIVPEVQNLPLTLFLELFALSLGLWAVKRYELDKPKNLTIFITTGNLAKVF